MAKKLLENCKVVYELEIEKNGWYLLSNHDFDKLLKLDMVPMDDILRMAQQITEKVGDCDTQLENFASIKFRDGCRIETMIIAVDTDESSITVAVGDTKFDFVFDIKKSKLDNIKSSIFLGIENGWIALNEVPGVAAFQFLQAYTKYLLGELEDMDWVDPVY